jgi:hypothetical protein
MSDWGKGVNNNIGWGQGADNDIGWGSIYDKSNAGETLLKSDLNIDAFIIEVDTSKPGTSNDNQFQFTGAQGDYDVVAKQNDIIVQTFNDLSGEETITFANGAGTYILEVNAKATNGFTGMRFNFTGDRLKLLKVKQWGVFNDTRNFLFNGCERLIEIANDVNWLNSKTSLIGVFRTTDLVILPNTLSLLNLSNGTATFQASDLDSLPDVMFLDNLENGLLMFFQNNLTDLPTGITLPNLSNGDRMLEGNTINTERYSKLLIDMEAGNNNTNVPFHGGGSKYNAAGETARNLLIANQNWSFTDGGLA